MMMSRHAWLCIIVAAMVAAAACSGGSNGGDGDTTPGAATATDEGTPVLGEPEDAIGLWVQRRLNLGFIADCDEARRPGDVGKQCARRRGERGDLLAFEVGPTFGQYTQLFVLKPEGGAWTIVHQESRDPTLPPVPGIPWPLESDAQVIVAGTGDCLRIRDQPTTRGTEIECLPDGTEVTVGGGPVIADNNEWWELDGHGWASATYLRYPEEAPTPEPEG